MKLPGHRLAKRLKGLKESFSQQVLSRLFGTYVLPLWPLIIVAFASNTIAAVVTGGIPLLIKWSVDSVLAQGASNVSALAVSFIICGLSLLRGLMTYVGGVAVSYVSQKMASKLQEDYFNKLLHSDLPFVTGQNSGTFLSNFSTDIQRLQFVMLSSALNFFQNALTIVTLVIALFILNPELALLGMLATPSATIFSRYLRNLARGRAHQNMHGLASLAALLTEVLSGFRIVKAYNQEEYEARKCRHIVRDINKSGLRAAMINSAVSPFVEMLSGFGIALVILFAGTQLRNHSLTVGQLGAFLLALPLAYQPLKALLGQYTIFQDGVAAAERVFAVLDSPTFSKDKPGAVPLTLTRGDVSFKDVSFSYYANPHYSPGFSKSGGGPMAVHELSFDIPWGQTVALVGPSGSGKSTILNLLMRFYEPLSGSIVIDGQDVGGVTAESLRSAVALVTQDPFLFDDTIEANIAYGAPGAHVAHETVIQAAMDADAHHFIMEQPHQYQTRVGQGGVRLSGGQKQRIAIARAMLKNAPILLLDEATSSLDTYSELQVQEALGRLMKGRTTLVIAHRLSTIINADKICVLSKGCIVESGTHNELIEKNGLYAKLYDIQFRKDQRKKGATKESERPAAEDGDPSQGEVQPGETLLA